MSTTAWAQAGRSVAIVVATEDVAAAMAAVNHLQSRIKATESLAVTDRFASEFRGPLPPSAASRLRTSATARLHDAQRAYWKLEYTLAGRHLAAANRVAMNMEVGTLQRRTMADILEAEGVLIGLQRASSLQTVDRKMRARFRLMHILDDRRRQRLSEADYLPAIVKAFEGTRVASTEAVGTVRVVSTVTSAQLYVDGRIAAVGKSVALPQGLHLLSAHAPGYAPVHIRVRVVAGVNEEIVLPFRLLSPSERALELRRRCIRQRVWLACARGAIEVSIAGQPSTTGAIIIREGGDGMEAVAYDALSGRLGSWRPVDQWGRVVRTFLPRSDGPASLGFWRTPRGRATAALGASAAAVGAGFLLRWLLAKPTSFGGGCCS